MVCLVEWILGRIEKKKKWEGKLFGGCLVERERGKRDGGAWVFSS